VSAISVIAFTEGVLKTMLLNKIKVSTVMLLLMAAFGAGAGLIYQAQATEPKTEQTDKQKQSNQDKDKLQGKWLRMALQGSVAQSDKDWRFEKGNISFLQHKAVRSAEELKQWGTASYHLDPSRTPGTIDLKQEDGKEVRGIYLLADDVLVICLSKAGAARPSEFTADLEARQELLQFQREEPKSRKPAN
jgi:uncharacterized protein (TIGR03067 family)